MASTSRQLELDAARLPRWLDGFAERHGPVQVTAASGEQIELRAQDGATVVLQVSFPDDLAADALAGGAPAGDNPASGASVPDEDPARHTALTAVRAAEILTANVAVPRDLAVLMVRRGGYAVAAVTAGKVTASKVGSKYVQGRTAAGGWSQQRFARRRDSQLHGLLVAAADVAVRLLTPVRAQTLVTAGDRALVERLLADPRLAGLAALPRGPHLQVGDPRNDDVKALPARLREIRLQLTEP